MCTVKNTVYVYGLWTWPLSGKGKVHAAGYVMKHWWKGTQTLSGNPELSQDCYSQLPSTSKGKPGPLHPSSNPELFHRHTCTEDHCQWQPQLVQLRYPTTAAVAYVVWVWRFMCVSVGLPCPWCLVWACSGGLPSYRGGIYGFTSWETHCPGRTFTLPVVELITQRNG